MRFRSLLLAMLALPTPPLLAQQVAEGETAIPDTIIVTGTRRLDRTVGESPVPIDIITSESLTRTGTTETARALRDAVPSFNFPQPSITDGTDVIRPATLRGLGPDQTLILLNGKRRHPSALLNINGSIGRGSQAVDINNIPSSALKRVEVLRDGAAAQYGSDAIAGVINFQLNDAREGGSFSLTYGQYSTNLAGVNKVTGLATPTGGTPVVAPDGTLVLTDNGKKLHVSDGATLTISGNVGLPLGAEGFVNVTAEWRDRDPTNRTGYDPRRQYITTGLLDSREYDFDRRSHRYGDARTEDLNLLLNMGMPLDEQVDFYAFGTYSKRDGESAGFYRRANDNRNVLSVYPDGFLPLITSQMEDYALTGGLKGEFSGWRFDVSMQYGRNQFDYVIKNTINASLGAASPTEFDAGGLVSSQWVNNLDISRDFGLGAMDLTLSAGLEYRRETFEVKAGEPNSYIAGPVRVGTNNPLITGPGATAFAGPGAQVFPGFQPIIGGVSITGEHARENVSAYLELDADITERWNVQLAGRYEKYDDFGSDWNGKIATLFRVMDWVSVRGAVSTGFRAPSLAQQFFAAAATNNIAGVLVDSVTLPVGNPVAQSLGSTPLNAETAFNWSVGAVFSPFSRFQLTIDYYQIDIDDRIILTDNIAATRDAAGNPTGTNPGLGVAQILNNAGFTNISAARFFINGIDTRTKGLDVVANYAMDLGNAGSLGLTAAYSWNKTDITAYNATPGALNQVPGIVLLGRLESDRIERGQPRDKFNIGVDWDWQWLGITLRGNRYGSAVNPGATQFEDIWLAPKFITDLEIRAKPWGGLELAIGANNLFDVYPSLSPTGQGPDPITGQTRTYTANNYFLPYSSSSPFGFNGRFLYGRASYRF